jgi:sulfatase modifying factor 1
MKPPSVFIIASNADYAPAWRVHQQLLERGMDCFFCDEAQLRVGEKGYLAKAERSLEAAGGLVVVAGSRERVESEWVRHMWRKYLEKPGRDRPVATMRCEGMVEEDLPRTLRRGGSLAFPEELAALSDRLTHPGEIRRPAPEKPTEGRRTMRILTAVTALNVLILGAVIWLLMAQGGRFVADAGAARPEGANYIVQSSDGKPAAGSKGPGQPENTAAGLAGAGGSGEGTLTMDAGFSAKAGSGALVPLGESAAAGDVDNTPPAGTPLYLTLGDVKLTFVFIPPGSFDMGSPEDEVRRGLDEPLHRVEISRGFWLARTECTQGLWRTVMGTEPSKFTGHPDLPVESVSWYDMAGSNDSFFSRMNRHRLLPAGWAFALPSEAQWEYACRAGTQTAFHFGKTITSSLANFDGLLPYENGAAGAYLGHTTRAGSYPPNPWGLYDMHGNVAEFCADKYVHQPAGQRDPLVTEGVDGRVVRGGSWWYHAWNCRSAWRESVSENLAIDDNTGFRLAIVPER